jgi:putative sterol carrier protein
MPMEVFTEEWSRACCQGLNRREGYRRVAADWDAPVVLVMERDPARGVEEERAVYLDLHRGECRGASLATERDLAMARYAAAAKELVAAAAEVEAHFPPPRL